MCGFSPGNKTFVHLTYVNLSIAYTLVEICRVDKFSIWIFSEVDNILFPFTEIESTIIIMKHVKELHVMEEHVEMTYVL